MGWEYRGLAEETIESIPGLRIGVGFRDTDLEVLPDERRTEIEENYILYS